MITSNRRNIQSLLESSVNWERLKNNLTSDIKGKRKAITSMMLENARNSILKENATVGATASTNIAKVAKVMLPLIRRVMPTVMAYDLVGVQPMNGPSAIINTMRFKFADNSPADGSGIVAGQEALSPYSLGCWYSGNNDMVNPGAGLTAEMEGQVGNRMQVEYLKQTVNAKTRRLSARFTLEAMQDAEAQYGANLESELTAGLAAQIVMDIDQEIITKLYSLAGVVRDTYDQDRTSGVATSVVDQHAALVTMLNRYSNDIARRIRMGSANFMVCSWDVVTVLQDARASAFARTTNGDFEAPTNNKSVGTLNGTMKVFANTLARDNTILIGYKGSDEATCAMIYCPYIPVSLSNPIPDPNTFENVMALMTRYGLVDFQNVATSLGNSSDFLSKIAVTNLRFS